MLDLSVIDLGMLAIALEDHPHDGSWWLNPETGEVWYCGHDLGEPDPEEQGAVFVAPLPSSEAYRDMEEFISLVPNRRAADLLSRAIGGRGAFRRFKDTLFEFPDLREAWFRFHDVRAQRRAIAWLRDEELIDEAVAERALAEHLDPQIGDGTPADPLAVAEAAAADLRSLYGDRLCDVVLFGSHARGDADRESDLDLLVVLRELHSPWEELRRMDDVLWRHSFEADVTLSAVPVALERWQAPDRPVLMRAKAEGRGLL